MAQLTEEDVGNIIALEHVNLQVPDQAQAVLFYVVGLGLTRDSFLNVGGNNNFASVSLSIPPAASRCSH